ncbi:porin [Chishuiella changwenlii]|uniref:porin n=1 Tax=Chishuiella changwenlii TaxID=1434701 RepID=UPI002FD93EEA
MNKIICGLFVFMLSLCHVYGQIEKDTIVKTDSIPDLAITSQEDTITKETEKFKFQQQPGLGLAASKIFFSKKRWSISGFGEFNYVPLQKKSSTDLGDLELSYSGLYRYSTFFGYRITDKLIWNSEFMMEFLHDNSNKTHHEIMVEAYFDYLWKDYLKARVGFYPITIGYVNNNDEPVMFYSVNRSEVERIIVPSTWIEFGAMFYGNISKDWSYAFGLSQGLISKKYLSGTWIRQGREMRIAQPKSIAINPQINYTGVKNLTLSASGYYGNSGQGEKVEIAGKEVELKSKINLTTAYAKYDWNNFRFVTVGVYGELGDTEKIYQLTQDDNGSNGQVLGKNVYGYLFEVGCDILPYIRKTGTIKHKKNFFFDNHEMKFSLFSRYERLNTHHKIHPDLRNLERVENNLNIWTFGFNFNTKENIVFKANYQYRTSVAVGDLQPTNHIIETGIGFIF